MTSPFYGSTDPNDLASRAAEQAQHDAEAGGEAQSTDPTIAASLWLQTQAKKPKKAKETDAAGIKSYSPAADTELDSDPVMAEDGQGLTSQSFSTQTDFKNKYGERASQEWVKEHNNELANNRKTYGVSEPPSWMKGSSTLSSPLGAVATPPKIASYQPPKPVGNSPTTLSSPLTPGTAQPIKNADGSVTTERSITVTDARLNGGKPTNIPTVWGGQIVSDDEAVDNAARSGRSWPAFNSIDEAVAAAKQRSNDLGTGSITSVGGAKVPNSVVSPPAAPNEVTLRHKQTGNIVTISTSQLPYMTNRDEFEEVPSTQPVTQKQSLTTSNPVVYAGTDPGSKSTNLALANRGNEEKPIETLATLSVQRQGGNAGTVAQESDRILKGVGALIQGDPKAGWAEAYLNDVARIAWAKQQRDSGEVADPRNAPPDYIEKWKDAFYGSDTSVPLVKELDQQMIDHAVSREPNGTAGPFDWRKAFGPNGEAGLISKQVASNDCGPNAFSTILRSRGYNLDPSSSFAFAEEHGYHDGEQFTGPQNYARMLRQEAGLDAQAVPLVWKQVDAELDAGRPVTLSGAGHYWVASAYRDTEQGRQYYIGATGAVVGNPQWATTDQIQYQGRPDTLITARGNVDPNSRSIQELGLRPAGSAPDVSRANLTRTSEVGSTPGGVAPGVNYAPSIVKASKQNNVDPLLVESMIDTESQGVADARSSRGAGGVMQLMPDTARSLGVQDVDDPDQNIQGGTLYFRQMLDMFDGDLDMALAAYNAGPAAVIKYGGVPPFAETQDYVKNVKLRYQQLVKQ